MRSLRMLAAVLGIPIMLSVGMIYLWPTSHSSIVFDQRSLDFGEVWESSEFRWKVIVRNQTSSRVILKEPSAVCSCTNISPRELDLPPGSVGEVSVTLDLMRREELAEGNSHDFSTQFQYLSSLDDSVYVATLRGKVQRWQIQPLPNVVIIPDYSVEQAPFVGSIDVTVHSPVKKLVLRATSGDFERVEAIQDEHDLHRWRLEVLPKIGIGPGPIAGDGVLEVQLDDGGVHPSIPVKFRGTVLSEEYIAPSQLKFGHRKQGEIIAAALTVGRRDGASVEIVGIDVSPSDLKLEWSCDRVDSLQVIKLSLYATGRGHQKADLRVRVDQGSSKSPKEINVPVTWFTENHVGSDNK